MQDRPYFFLSPTCSGWGAGAATFGLGGIQKIIAQSVKKDVYFASSLEDALDWIKKQNETG
jgi:hypothetical protein